MREYQNPFVNQALGVLHAAAFQFQKLPRAFCLLSTRLVASCDLYTLKYGSFSLVLFLKLRFSSLISCHYLLVRS